MIADESSLNDFVLYDRVVLYEQRTVNRQDLYIFQADTRRSVYLWPCYVASRSCENHQLKDVETFNGVQISFSTL